MIICDTCGIYISIEHGGVVCENCDSVFCNSDECIGEKNLDTVTQMEIFDLKCIPECTICSEPKEED